MQESGDGVTAFFEDGSNATGDILIGADGIHSKVREHVLGPSAPTPTYIGSCTMSGFLPVDSITVPCGFNFPAMIFTPIGLIMAMAILIDPEGKTIAKGREGWREYEVSGEAARVAKAEHADCTTEPIRSLLDNVKDESVRIWAPYEIPELPTWHLGRICLIGDAAHALPLNGQGSAQALGTQHSGLAYTIQDQAVAQGYEKLFAHLERVRRVRIQRVWQLSKKGGQIKSSSTGPWAWWVKKWLFRAFFAWNRFIIRATRIISYDVTAESIEVKVMLNSSMEAFSQELLLTATWRLPGQVSNPCAPNST